MNRTSWPVLDYAYKCIRVFLFLVIAFFSIPTAHAERKTYPYRIAIEAPAKTAAGQAMDLTISVTDLEGKIYSKTLSLVLFTITPNGETISEKITIRKGKLVLTKVIEVGPYIYTVNEDANTPPIASGSTRGIQ
jgi:hypothetical protein